MMLRNSFKSTQLIRSTSIKLRSILNDDLRFVSNSSTDQTEIDKFDKFARSTEYNWHTSEMSRPLRNLNKLRVPLIKDQLLSIKRFNREPIDDKIPLDNYELLDVGSGGGLLSECLARLGANVTAIDANEHNIKFSIEHLEKISSLKAKLNYVHSDLDNFSELDRKFDAIVASEILEHVDDVENFIKNCSKLLRDNGLLFITTINQTLQSYLCAILLAENVLNLVPKNTHQYKKLVLLNGLRLILEESK